MVFSLLAALVLAPSPKYDVFLGMSPETTKSVRGMVEFMRTEGADWTPRVEATAPVGRDTLVMWSWPMKGTHGVGLQIYGPDGQFKLRLEDSQMPSARAAVCAGRYVVAGGNTLRVWDAQQKYRLIARKTFVELSQFAELTCGGKVLYTASLLGNGGLQLLAFHVPALTLPAPKYNIRHGLSDAQWRVMVKNTMGQVGWGYLPVQTLRTRTGDTLVHWASSAGLDPKGPNGIGIQLYGPDDRFVRWLPDTRGVDRNFVLCGRYLVGGAGTLRVWDTEDGYRVVGRRDWLSLYRRVPIACASSGLNVAIAGQRFKLPDFSPAR